MSSTSAEVRALKARENRLRRAVEKYGKLLSKRPAGYAIVDAGGNGMAVTLDEIERQLHLVEAFFNYENDGTDALQAVANLVADRPVPSAAERQEARRAAQKAAKQRQADKLDRRTRLGKFVAAHDANEPSPETRAAALAVWSRKVRDA